MQMTESLFYQIGLLCSTSQSTFKSLLILSTHLLTTSLSLGNLGTFFRHCAKSRSKPLGNLLQAIPTNYASSIERRLQTRHGRNMTHPFKGGGSSPLSCEAEGGVTKSKKGMEVRCVESFPGLPHVSLSLTGTFPEKLWLRGEKKSVERYYGEVNC